MPWKVKDVMEQRIEFVVRVLQKESTVTQLCEEYGISPHRSRIGPGKAALFGINRFE